MEKKSDPIKVSPKMDSGVKNGSRLMKELWAKKKKKKAQKKRELVNRKKESKILGMRDHVANGG
jgi:hypothetical protein